MRRTYSWHDPYPLDRHGPDLNSFQDTWQASKEALSRHSGSVGSRYSEHNDGQPYMGRRAAWLCLDCGMRFSKCHNAGFNMAKRYVTVSKIQ